MVPAHSSMQFMSDGSRMEVCCFVVTAAADDDEKIGQ